MIVRRAFFSSFRKQQSDLIRSHVQHPDGGEEDEGVTVARFGVAKVVRMSLVDKTGSVAAVSKLPPSPPVRFLTSEGLRDVVRGEGVLRVGRFYVPRDALEEELVGLGTNSDAAVLSLDDGQDAAATTTLTDESECGSDVSLSSMNELEEVRRRVCPVSISLRSIADEFPGVVRVRSDAIVRPKNLPSAIRVSSECPRELTAGEKALFAAACACDLPAVMQCVDEGADIQTLHPVHGGSPLHAAAGSGRASGDVLVDMVRSLGANVNAVAANGSTPLHWAAGAGNSDAINALLEAGADPHLRTYTWTSTVFGKGSGQTAAHWAAESGHERVIADLCGAAPLSVLTEDERGATPRALSTKEGKLAAEFMLERLESQEYVCVEFSTEDAIHQLLPASAGR